MLDDAIQKTLKTFDASSWGVVKKYEPAKNGNYALIIKKGSPPEGGTGFGYYLRPGDDAAKMVFAASYKKATGEAPHWLPDGTCFVGYQSSEPKPDHMQFVKIVGDLQIQMKINFYNHADDMWRLLETNPSPAPAAPAILAAGATAPAKVILAEPSIIVTDLSIARAKQIRANLPGFKG